LIEAGKRRVTRGDIVGKRGLSLVSLGRNEGGCETLEATQDSIEQTNEKGTNKKQKTQKTMPMP